MIRTQIDLCDELPCQNWHENFIIHLASLIRPSLYVELGLDQCRLFNRIIPFAKNLIGVDINPEAEKDILDLPKTKFINASSKEFVKELAVNPMQIDMLFINAENSVEAVFQDFWNIFPYILPHGFILIHHTHPENETMINSTSSGTAYQAIELLGHDTSEYEFMTIPVSPGLTICRKRREQLSWKEKACKD